MERNSQLRKESGNDSKNSVSENRR